MIVSYISTTYQYINASEIYGSALDLSMTFIERI